jgi:hypothetical protein
MNSKISKHVLNPNLNLEIYPSSFGENVTSIVAVSLVLEKIINLEL